MARWNEVLWKGEALKVQMEKTTTIKRDSGRGWLSRAHPEGRRCGYGRSSPENSVDVHGTFERSLWTAWHSVQSTSTVFTFVWRQDIWHVNPPARPWTGISTSKQCIGCVFCTRVLYSHPSTQYNHASPRFPPNVKRSGGH